MKNIIKISNLKAQYKKIENQILESINKTFKSCDFINGSEVIKFEKKLKKRFNVNNVITCGNGTDALQIAIMSLNLKVGSEIIIPAFSYISTIETIILLGMKPILIDVKSDTFNIDELKIKKKITKKTKLILPVHLYGQNSNMEKIMKIAKKYKLFVIEDAAQSIDSKIKFLTGNSFKSGTVGDIGCFSFFPNKNLGCYGDGGCLITNNNLIAKKIRMIKNHGQIKKYKHEIVGINSRLDTIQAGFLNIKLNLLYKENLNRMHNANFYYENLKFLKEILLPKKIHYSSHIYHQYTIRVLKGKRNSLQKYLNSKKIQSVIYYPQPLHLQKGYSSFVSSDLKISEKISKEVLSIPIHPYLTNKELKYIVREIKSFYE